MRGAAGHVQVGMRGAGRSGAAAGGCRARAWPRCACPTRGIEAQCAPGTRSSSAPPADEDTPPHQTAAAPNCIVHPAPPPKPLTTAGHHQPAVARAAHKHELTSVRPVALNLKPVPAGTTLAQVAAAVQRKLRPALPGGLHRRLCPVPWWRCCRGGASIGHKPQPRRSSLGEAGRPRIACGGNVTALLDLAGA